ncbi:MAG: hypothetical protein ACRBB0_25485 [Pelagimonas sp.]|uniref:hypothetical protein n=1 Tax=Pelagimonas sp. TaxID=2073170 RepID=UPI003D6A535E
MWDFAHEFLDIKRCQSSGMPAVSMGCRFGLTDDGQPLVLGFCDRSSWRIVWRIARSVNQHYDAVEFLGFAVPEAICEADPDDLLSPFPNVSGLSVSRPWVSLENPKDIRAFVSDALEEELYEMAALFQADSVPNPVWAAVRERIVLAVSAYEGPYRRLLLAGASMERRRLSLREPEFWTGIYP